MYIFKNALVSITRNKGRNLLIALIIVVIAIAATVTLAIRNSASELISSYEAKYDVEATIGINRESMRGQMQMNRNMSEEEREEQRNNMNNIFQSVSNLTIDEIENYGDSNYVTEYYYQISVGVNATALEKASMTTNAESNMLSQKGGKENFQNLSNSDFTLIGYSSISAMEDFISGKYTISSGEVTEDLTSNTCVINSELATLNNISVGDELTFVDPLDETNTIVLKVTGIYEENSDTDDAMGMFTASANTIITNTTVISTMTSQNVDMPSSITPTFILTDKNVIEDFESEIREKGLNEYLALSTNLDTIENSTSTISNVNTFATTFLVITLIIGGIVLFVINMINIRERKYEIGVLRTIGMKKSCLTLQFVSELLIVGIVALIIGAGIGSICSVPVSNYLLEQEISSSMQERDNIRENFGGKEAFNKMDKVSGVVNVNAFTSIDAAVDFTTLLQLLGLGVSLILVSSLASMISIQKFSPLTILKERS